MATTKARASSAAGTFEACPACSEPTLTSPYDRYYAWALVQVHQSGNVSLQVSGFSESFGPVQDLTQYDVANLQ